MGDHVCVIVRFKVEAAKPKLGLVGLKFGFLSPVCDVLGSMIRYSHFCGGGVAEPMREFRIWNIIRTGRNVRNLRGKRLCEFSAHSALFKLVELKFVTSF